MSCSDYSRYLDFWLNGQFADAVICPYHDVIGAQPFALLFFGGLGLALYIYSDGVSLPMSLLVILGGLVIPELPGIAVQAVAVAALLAIMIAGYLMQSRTRDFR